MSLWEQFMEKAVKEDEYMSQILAWYGDIGVDLVPNDKTGYAIVPIYQEDGGGWQNKEEWEHERQWLLPYGRTVARILRQLREENKCEDEGELVLDF